MRFRSHIAIFYLEIFERNLIRLPGEFPVSRGRDKVRHRPGVVGLTENIDNGFYLKTKREKDLSTQLSLSPKGGGKCIFSLYRFYSFCKEKTIIFPISEKNFLFRHIIFLNLPTESALNTFKIYTYVKLTDLTISL